MFGPFPAGAATKACDTVKRIVSWLPDKAVSSIFKQGDNSEDDSDEFGAGIKFTHSSPMEMFTNWKEPQKYKDPVQDFHMGYTKAKDMPQLPVSEEVDSNWLRKQVEKNFDEKESGMPINDLCSTIFDFLSSSKTDSELQNDVMFLCLIFHILLF